jgi:DNA (cytosine-5)-methyltransferase 1
MTDKIRVLSLFSGCGGMDLGLEGGFLAPKKSFGANETVIVDEKCINGFVR